MTTPTPSTLATPYRPGIAQGEGGSGVPLLQCLTEIRARTGAVSLPWYPAGKGATSLSLLVQAVAQALKDGLTVEVSVHLDNDPANAYLPWDQPDQYQAWVKTLAVAIAFAVPTAERSRLILRVGNENSPRKAGDNPESWGLVNQLFDLWKQCCGHVRNACPGCKVSVPAPFDQGPSYLKAWLAQPVTDAPIELGADIIDLHYPFENGLRELPGEDVGALLDQARARFGAISIGEFVWNLGTVATTAETLAYCSSRGVPCFAWQLYGDKDALVNNPAQWKALGFVPLATTAGPGTATTAGAT